VCVFVQILIPLKQHYIVLCPEVELDGHSAAFATTFRLYFTSSAKNRIPVVGLVKLDLISISCSPGGKGSKIR
jgi:hypothetical protein